MNFCGITLQWDYENHHVTLSMLGYIKKTLQQFTHPPPKQPQHAPHTWIAPSYSAKVQYTSPDDTSLPLDKHFIKKVQEVIGTLLFTGQVMVNTLLVALSPLATAQTKGTKNTMDALVQVLDYTTTHPDAAIRYYSSNMVLYVHSVASYLSKPKACSRVGGYIGKNNKPSDNSKPNGPIHVESRIL
jgi:hypothetical protein